MLRPRPDLLDKGGGPYSLSDMGVQSWPVPISAPVPSASCQGARSGYTGFWLLVKGGVQGQGKQAGEAWLSHQSTV